MNNEIICPIYYEDWKPITKKSVPEIRENMYSVSNFGRIKNDIYDRLLTPVITNNGYYRVWLSLENGHGRYFLIHRIVMIEFNPIENYKEMQVNHIYGEKSWNSVSELEWATGSKNITHAYQNGLKSQYHGEDCPWATITNEQAELVAQMIVEQKYLQREIAEITGIPLHIVHNIACGTTWIDIYNKYELYKYKREPRKGFSDEELHLLCNYFQENSYKYEVKSDLYRQALKELFDIDYIQSMSASMSRIFNHKTRKDITDKYNF